MLENVQTKNRPFECPICMKLFNYQQRYPRLLSCGHNFCEECLTKLSQAHQYLKCPYCNFIHNEFRLALAYKNTSFLTLMSEIDINEKECMQIKRQTFCEIVDEMEKIPKGIKKLVVMRTRDDENNPFDYDLIRKNKKSMRFYTLLCLFQKMQQFEFYIKFSAHGFQQCLAESINYIKSIKKVKIFNSYDQYHRMKDFISLVKIPNIQCQIKIGQWK